MGLVIAADVNVATQLVSMSHVVAARLVVLRSV